MEVDAKSKICPVCSYEFPGYSLPVKWVAVLLLVLLLLYFVL